MKTSKLLITSLLAAAAMSVPAHADIYISYGANKTNDTGGNGALTFNSVYGWNEATKKTNSTEAASTILKDTSGADSGVTTTWSSKNTYMWTTATEEALKGYLDDGAVDGHYAQVTLSGISYLVYDVVVLAATDSPNAKFAAVTINGTAYTSSDGGIAIAGNDAWGASQNATIVPGVNSMTLSGVTGASLSINGGASANNNGIRGGIAGIKIINTSGTAHAATLDADSAWTTALLGSAPWTNSTAEAGTYADVTLSANVNLSASAGIVTDAIVVSGGHTLTLSAAEDNTAGIDLIGLGIVRVADGSTLSLANGTILNFKGSNSSITGAISGAGSLVAKSGSSLNLAGAALTDFTGTVSAESGSTVNFGGGFAGVNFTSGTALGTYNVSFASDSNLKFGLTSDLANSVKLGDSDFSGKVYITAGQFTINESDIGNGTWVLEDGVILHQNGTTVAGSTIYDGATGITTINNDMIVNSGTVEFRVNAGSGSGHGDKLVYAGDISGSGTLKKTNDGVVDFTGSIDLGGFTNASGTTNFNGTTTLGGATLTGGKLAVAAGANVSVSGTVEMGTATLDGGTAGITAGTLKFGYGGGVNTATIQGKVNVTGNLQESSSGVENGETISLAEGASLSVGRTFGTTEPNADDGRQHAYVVNVGAGASFSAGTIAHGDTLTVNIGGGNAAVSATTLVLNGVWGSRTHAFTGQGADVSTLSVGTISLNNKPNKTTTFSVSNARLEVGAGGITGNSSTPVFLSGVTLGVRDGADSWSSDLSMTFSGAMGVDVGEGKKITLSGTLSVNGIVEKIGAGTLELAGTANISGTTTVSGGTLDLSGGNITLGSTIQNSGTVTVDSETTFNISSIPALRSMKNEDGSFSVISGGTVTDWNTLTTNSFTFNGAAFSEGSLGRYSRFAVGSDGKILFETTAANLVWSNAESNNTWDTETSGNWTNGTTTGDRFYSYDSVEFNTDATVTVADGGVTADLVTISAGTVSFSGGAITALGGVFVTGTSAENIATLKLNAADDFASGTVITVNEGGKFELNGKTQNLGENGISVVLNGGTLSNAEAVAENKRQLYGLTLTADSTVEVRGRFGLVGAVYAPVALDLGGHTLTKTGDAAFVLVNTTVKNGTLSVTEGSVTDSDNGANRGISLTQGAAITVSEAGSVNLKITSMQAGTSLTLAGTGEESTITLSGSTSISGDLTIGNATVNASGSGDIFNYNVSQTQTITLNAGGELALGTQRQTVCSNVDFVLNGGKISGTGADNYGHALDFFKDNTVTATADSEISANMTIRRGNNNPDGTLAFDVKDGVTLTISGDILTPHSTLEDVNSVLVKQGSGMLVLSGANTYDKGTRIEAGTVVAGSETALGTETVNVTGDATLQMNPAVSTFGNSVSVADGKTLSVQARATDFTGTLSGNGNVFVKTLYSAMFGTADVLTLSGDNTDLAGTLSVGGLASINAKHVNALGSGMLEITKEKFDVVRTGTVNAAVAGVKLNNVSILLKDASTAVLTADADCNFTVADGATLYLDIGALTETVLTGDHVALTIAAGNAITGETFFNEVLVGTYGSGNTWIDDTEWAYKADSWNAAEGTLLLISVPEPSVFGLLAGLGALALAGTRRRRRKA